MSSRALLALFLLLLTATSGCAFKHAPLYQPASITVTGPKDAAAVGKAVRTALRRLDWAIVQEAPGIIDAKQTKSGFWASIRVTYDARAAEVRYLDSAGLNYETGDAGPRIHDHYNLWLRNVERDLKKVLAEE